VFPGRGTASYRGQYIVGKVFPLSVSRGDHSNGDWRRNPKAHPITGGSAHEQTTRCKNYQSGTYRSKAPMPKAAEIKGRRRRRRHGVATD